MINSKIIYNQILTNSQIINIIPEENILDNYPDEAVNFPCIIYTSESQTDIEYADNKSNCVNCSVDVHIFTKALENFPTTTEIGIVVDKVFKENDFQMVLNVEQNENEIRHRIITFRKQMFS